MLDFWPRSQRFPTRWDECSGSVLISDSTASRYCTACGSPLHLHGRFCPGCGRSVERKQSLWRGFREKHFLLQAVAWVFGWWFMVHFYIWSGTHWAWYWKAAASAPIVILTVPIAAI